ncbi:MAG: sunset domain-containing protein, partial [Acidimicrobiales bacterium]
VGGPPAVPAPAALAAEPAPAAPAAGPRAAPRARRPRTTPGPPLEEVRERLAAIEIPAAAPPRPAGKARKKATQTAPAWVEPTAGACPDDHPIKVKLSSRLFHLPGMMAYERTRADRCYGSAADAERDGFTRSRR